MENKLNLVIAKLNEIKADYFEEALEKFNKIKEQTSRFASTNLKLYHASYRLYQLVQDGIMTDEQSNSLFSEVCEREYEYFEEWEKENVPNIERVYIRRTSSFYYQPKTWNEEVIGRQTVETLLEGKEVSNLEIFGEMHLDLYDLFFDCHSKGINYTASEILETLHNQLEEEHTLDDFETEMDEFFKDEINLLENLLSDLSDLGEYVLECQKAYDYLRDHKTKEHELATLEYYLDFEIENYISTDLAENIYSQILDEHTPLNQLTELHVYIAESDDENETFTITAESNLLVTTYKTDIKRSNDKAIYLIAFTLGHIRKEIEKNFSF